MCGMCFELLENSIELDHLNEWQVTILITLLFQQTLVFLKQHLTFKPYKWRKLTIGEFYPHNEPNQFE